MQNHIKRRKKRGKLYFSSTKALKTSRMGRKKAQHEKYETTGINKVLDFEDTKENATLSTVDESKGPSTSQSRGCQSGGASKDVGTQSNPASEEHSAEDELDGTERWVSKTYT